MSFEFKLPDIGEGVTEGEVVKWMVKEGDQVEEDQAILEIMTDKATVEISAPQSAKVEKLNAKEGDVVPVGETLVTFSGSKEGASKSDEDEDESESESKEGKDTKSADEAKEDDKDKKKDKKSSKEKKDQDEDSDAEDKKKTKSKESDKDQGEDEEAKSEKKQEDDEDEGKSQKSEGKEKKTPLAASSKSSDSQSSQGRSLGGRVLASPATRRLAREMGVDLSQFEGSGPGGRVTRQDLMQGNGAVQAGDPVAYVPKPATQKPKKSKKMEFGRRSVSDKSGEEKIPLRGIRKAIAERMHESKRTAAHFTHVDEIDMTELVALRDQTKDIAAEKGVSLSYLPFIIRAITMALKEFPALNANLDLEEKEITYKYYYNIGIAVATNKDELVVPVIKDADQKGILDLASEIESLGSKARAGRLSMEDLKGGTFTLTSMGKLGGLFATPVINYPEVAILGFHEIKDTPVVRDGQIVVRKMAHFSISLDHRMVDGAVGASFLKQVIEYLENPNLMLLNS